MDRTEIEERQIAERYLQGKLTAEEARAFEETYLADPEVLDELMLTEKLQQGLRAHGGQVERNERNAHNEPGGRFGRRRRWTHAFDSPRYAAAASVLLAVSVVLSGTLFLENRGLRENVARAPSAIGPTRLLPLVTVRGAAVNVVEKPAAEEWTVFLVDAGFTEYDEYRAVLSRRTEGASERIQQTDGLTPAYDGMLAVGLPGSLLAPGEYEIAIGGRMLDWPADRAFDLIATTPLRIVAEQ